MELIENIIINCLKMETDVDKDMSEVKEDREEELYDMASTPQIQSELFVGCVKVEVEEDDNYKEHTSDNLQFEKVFVKEEPNDDILLEDTDEVRSLPDTSMVDPQDEQEMEEFNTQEDTEITIEEMKPEGYEWEGRSYEDEVEKHHFDQAEDVKSTIADMSPLKVQAPTRTYQRAVSSNKRLYSWGVAETEKGRKVEDIAQQYLITDELLNPAKETAEEESMSVAETEKARKVEDIAQQCLIKDELLNPAKETAEEESMSKLPSVNPNITVFIDIATDNKLKVYDRRHKCLFCKKRYIGMATHLVKEHSNLKEVSCIMKLTSLSLQRRQHLIHLTRIGDFQHNVQALMTGSFELIVLRQSESFVGQCNRKHFLPCPDCAGFLHKSQLRRHHRLCLVKGAKFPIEKRKLLQESRALLMSQLIPMDGTSFKRNVLYKLTSKFGLVARSDCLIMLAGQYLYYSDKSQDAMLYHTTLNARTSFVRMIMQKLGGLLLSCRRLYGNQKLMFHQLLVPQRLPFLMKTIRALLLSRSQGFGKLEMCKILYPQIITAVFLWRGKCLFDLTSPCAKADKVMQFYYHFAEVWKKEINSVLEPENASNQTGNFQQIYVLPFTSDLVVLKNKMVKLTNELNIVKSNSIDCLWFALAETTIVLLCLFNPVDFSTIENIKIAEYAVRPDWSVDSPKDYENKMSNITYHLAAKRIVVCTTIEHSGEEVVILLTPEIKKAIDVLIRKRKLTSVSLGNPYVFASQYYNQSTIKAVNCIYNLCIKSVSLLKDIMKKNVRKRQYISYVSQISDMSFKEMNWVRDYLQSPLVDKDSNSFADVFRVCDITQLFNEDENEVNELNESNTDLNNKIQNEIGQELQLVEEQVCNESKNTTSSDENQFQSRDISVHTGIFEGYCADVPVLAPVEVTNQRKMEIVSRIGKWRIQKRWSASEMNIVIEYFKEEIQNEEIPGKMKCVAFLLRNKRLVRDRNWMNIKSCVANEIEKRKKMQEEMNPLFCDF